MTNTPTIVPLDQDDPLRGVKCTAKVGGGIFSLSFPDLTFEQFEGLFTVDAQFAILGSIAADMGIDAEEFEDA